MKAATWIGDGKWERCLLGLVVLGLLLAALHHVAACVRYPYPLDYPEGVIANWVQRAADGLCLYPPPSEKEALHNPYPPLFFVLAAPLQNRLPHAFLASRLLAMAGWLTSGVLVLLLATAGEASPPAGAGYRDRRTVACSRRERGPYDPTPRKRLNARLGANVGRSGARRAWAALGTLCVFLLSPLAVGYGAMARVDTCALAAALGAVVVLCRRGLPWTVLAAALALAAVAVKPTLAAALVVGAGFSVMRGREHALAWVTTVLAGGAATLLLTGVPIGSLLHHLVTLNRLPFSLIDGVGRLGAFAARHPLVVAGVVGLLLERQPGDVCWWYALVACMALPVACKVGADQNYFLELLAVGTVGLARMIARVPDAAQPTVALMLAVQLLLYLPVRAAPVFTRTYDQELAGGTVAFTPRRGDFRVGAEVVNELRRGTHVLSQSPGMLLAAGHMVTYQPYQYAQLARIGRWDPSPVVARVRQQSFDLIMCKADREERAATMPGVVLDAVAQHYREHRHIGPYQFFVPAD